MSKLPSRPQPVRGLFRAALRLVGQLFQSAPTPEQRPPALAPLLRLEDRRLLSAVALTPEFRVNTFTAGEQRLLPDTTQAVALHPTTGEFLVVWSSKGQDGSGQGVYGQRYDTQGNPQGGEFRVNSVTTGDQENASAAIAPDGSFVITWADRRSEDWDIYARSFDQNGLPRGGEFRVNSQTQQDQSTPALAMDPAGNFVVAWARKDQDGDGWGVFARRFNPGNAPQGSEFQVNTFTDHDQFDPAVAMDPGGNFVVAWASKDQDGDGWGVFARRFNPSAVAQGSEFQVNTTTKDDQFDPALAIDPSGNFVVAWTSDNQDGNNDGVYARRYDSGGAAQGGEFLVNTFTDHDQQYPTVAMNASGFVIAWASKDQDGDGRGVYAQRYGLAGAPLGSEFQANTVTQNDQTNPAVALDAVGRFVIVWDGNGPGDGQGVYGRRFQVPGIAVTPATGLQTNESGATAAFTVVLTSPPSADVTINLSSSDPGEGTLSVSSLTFTPANWDVPQLVTVTGTNDFLPDGSIVYTIVTAPASSADPAYNGLDAADVSVSNNDNETPGVTVTPTSGLVTTEDGGTATFSVVLNTPPLLLPVTVNVSSSDTTEGTVDQSSLTFDGSSWNVPQVLTITGSPGVIADGDTPYTIVLTLSTLDLAYLGVNPADVSVINLDTDNAGILVTPTDGLTTTEAGGSASFRVVLTSQPLANVTLALGSSDPSEGTPSITSLTFTPSNWNAPRVVFVTGVNDLQADGDLPYTITFAAAVSSDPGYSGLVASDVLLRNLDDDKAGIEVKPISTLTVKEGASATIEVVLTSSPTANVTVPVEVVGSKRATLSSAALTFTPANWDQPQRITLTAVDDKLVNGNESFVLVAGSAVSGDPTYDGLGGTKLQGQVLDNDKAPPPRVPSPPGPPPPPILISPLPTPAPTPISPKAPSAAVQPAPAPTLRPLAADPGAAGAPGPSPSEEQPVSQAPAEPARQSEETAAVEAHQPAPAPFSTAFDGRDPSLFNPPDAALVEHVATVIGNLSPAPRLSSADLETPPRSPVSPTPAAPAFHLDAAVFAGLSLAPREEGSSTSGGTSAVVAGPTAQVMVQTWDAVPAYASAAQAQRWVPPLPVGPSESPLPGPAPAPAREAEWLTLGNTTEGARLARPTMLLPAELLWTGLDRAGEQGEIATLSTEVHGIALTGLMAGAGYVLLNTRAVYWLLSLLAARPLWRRFDPLEVLFAWEKEAGQADSAEQDESLVSLAGSVQEEASPS
ncbi:MAG: hypothetical protein L0Z62_44365 [Gemmataceae bacterium]|nr:hypothetical protein [Gemmataceae bacterium]